MKKQQKVIYYSDEINDDFATTNGKIKQQRQVLGDYKYYHGKNFFWKIGEFLLYRLFAIPLAYVYTYIFQGLRVRGRKNVKSLKGGYFLYGNHTQMVSDAFIPSIISCPKKTNILINRDIVSIPVAKNLVPFLGGMPIPSDREAMRNMLFAMQMFLSQKQAVAIYPEAHVWPYYNDIRPFKDVSFAYPIKFDVPAVPFVVTFRKRKIFKHLKPKLTVYVGQPIYPADCIDKSDMRNKVYNFMKETIEKYGSFEYIKYVKKENNK